MLQSIRDRSQGWLTWFLVIIICLSFALWGIHSYLESGSSEQVIATVDGAKLTKQQLKANYDRLRQQLLSQAPSNFLITPKIEQQLKAEAYDQLINTQVLTKAARNNGYRVSSQQLTAVITQIPAFQIQGQFSSERFTSILRHMGYSTDSFLKSLQNEILINQAHAGFLHSAFMLNEEVQYLQKLLKQSRDITYAIIPAASFSASITLSEQQLRDYYAQHKTDYTVPEQLSISYIELTLDKLVAEQKVSEADIKQYYQDNAQNFITPGRYQLAHILIKSSEAHTKQATDAVSKKLNLVQHKLKQKEKFEVLARKMSDDVVSARHDGNLGWVYLADLEPAVRAAIEKLKVSGVTKPISTKYGFEIFKLIAMEPATRKSYDQVKADIRQRLAQQKAQAQFRQLSDKMANLSFSNPNSLELVSQQTALPIQQTELFSRENGKTSLTKNSNVIAAAFSKDVLDGNNSDLVELTPGHVLVLRMKQYRPSSIQSFEHVKGVIKEQLMAQQTQASAKALSVQVASELKAGKSTTELAKKHALHWHSVHNLTRHSETPAMTIVRLAFNLSPALNSKQAVVQNSVLPNGDSVVIILNKINDPKATNLSKNEYKAFTNELAASYAELAYQQYVAYLIKKASIKEYKSEAS